jgi:hypothetical protein
MQGVEEYLLDVAIYVPADRYQSFGGTRNIHLHGESVYRE